MVCNQSSADNGSSSAPSNVCGWSLMNAAIFPCPLPLSYLLTRFSNNLVYRSITFANVGGGGGGSSLFTRLFPTFFSTSSSPPSCTSSTIGTLSSCGCLCPCLRLWCSWLPLLCLPLGCGATGSSSSWTYHSVAISWWSRILSDLLSNCCYGAARMRRHPLGFGCNKITSKQRHTCMNKHTIFYITWIVIHIWYKGASYSNC